MYTKIPEREDVSNDYISESGAIMQLGTINLREGSAVAVGRAKREMRVTSIFFLTELR